MSKFSPEYQKILDGCPEEMWVDDYLKHCKPEWATGVNKFGEIIVGTQLLTKDGRRIGNARVSSKIPTYLVDVIDHGGMTVKVPVTSFNIVTDAGNEVCITLEEIHNLFHIGVYFVDELTRN